MSPDATSRGSAALLSSSVTASVVDPTQAVNTDGQFATAKRTISPAQRLRRLGQRRAPLSFAQRRLWFLHQLNPSSALYNLPLALRLKGELSLRALQSSLDAIVARHEALRTRFVAQEGEPWQIIDDAAPLRLETVTLPKAPVGRREEQLHDAISSRIHAPFDLAAEQPLRATVVQLDDDEHVLLIVAHHIAADGWSWHVFCTELSLHYKGFLTEWPTALPELPVQYADFARWRQESVVGPEMERLLVYWRKQLEGAPAFLDLPTDRPRPSVSSFRGGTVSTTLPLTLVEGLRRSGLREGATLFMTLLAGLQVLLGRYARQSDVIVGSPIANRTTPQVENLIGFFVNMLPMRADLSGNPTFRDLLRRVRSTALEAYAHQEMPYEKLVEELRPERHASRPPLVQVAFGLQNTPGTDLRLPGLKVAPLEVWTDTAKLDLTLLAHETPQGLSVTLEFNRDLFDRDTAQRFLGHWRTLLDSVAADMNQRIGALPILTPTERRQLLQEWNSTARTYPRDKAVHRLVEAQAQRAPDAIAVADSTRALSYRELDRQANQLAHLLLRHGARVGDPIAVCLDRSHAMVEAWLGILKSGAAYVPIDPEYPTDRKRLMIEDTGATIVVTLARFRAAFEIDTVAGENLRLICLDEIAAQLSRESHAAPEVEVNGESLAYICYTSGSTGQPKGVRVPHRAIARLVCNTDYVTLDSRSVVAQLANAAFDAATFEVWGALINGARLTVLPTSVLLSPPDLALTLRRERIDTLFLTTGAFNEITRQVPDAFAGLEQVLTGGEAANPSSFAAVLRNGAPERLLNVYGPTECTTFATSEVVDQIARDATSVPIGRPIANTTAYILDERRALVPIGVPGELYLGGDGVALGYHNRPELTAEKFVPDPVSTHATARLYRTGDLARWRPDGRIEFLGRTDAQIKIRGYRIEPGEIEATLQRHASVQDALVVTETPTQGDVRLQAFVTPRVDAALDTAELREFLQKILPAYLVPAAIVPLAKLPLNATGKVDRAALPRLGTVTSVTIRDAAAPGRNALEQQLAAAFSTVLGVSEIGIHDGFFELGGHSLLAVRLVARIEKLIGRAVPVMAIFQAPTVAKLAAWIETPPTAEVGEAFLTLRSAGHKNPLFLVHGVGGGMIWGYTNLTRHLDADQPVYVFKSRGLEGQTEPTTIRELAERYVADLRRFRPSGPYQLAGYCFGGNVAYEMACLLREQGHEVRFVGLFNSSPPNSSYDHLDWSPLGLLRFVANLRHTASAVLAWEPKRRRQFFAWKFRNLQRRLTRRLRRERPAQEVEIEELVDISDYSGLERAVWCSQVNALRLHHTSRYEGAVTLFRSPGHSAVSSFDSHFGWREFAPAVRAVIVPGAHESILEEPQVRTLAAEISACLDGARAQTGTN